MCSDPSPGQGSATTTPTRNRCSTPCRRSPAERLIPAGLPPAAIPERGRGLQLGSSIRFVTPSQRHSGKAIEICRHRARVYELARQRHPLRWSGTTRCWHQPEVVWINPPPPENDANQLRWLCTPDRRQERRLYWQLPTLRTDQCSGSDLPSNPVLGVVVT